MKQNKEIKVAVIDMNNGLPNQGIRSILGIISSYQEEHLLNLSVQLFDLRAKNELPGMEYDIYISSGGGGSPFEGENKQWENSFFGLLDDITSYNLSHQQKKHVFLICHSFQLACRKYRLGTVKRRNRATFGIFPVQLTASGEQDPIFAGLQNPFDAADSREWQVVDNPAESFEETGMKVLAYEKQQSDQDPCMMSVRFSQEIVGTQFHPEAGKKGMKAYLINKGKRETIIKTHGEGKYFDMLQGLEDPERIRKTKALILPNFLNAAIQSFK